jgi:hypothetical protein
MDEVPAYSAVNSARPPPDSHSALRSFIRVDLPVRIASVIWIAAQFRLGTA